MSLRRSAAGCAALAAVVVLAACGSSSSGGSSTSSAATSGSASSASAGTSNPQYSQTLATLYKGDFSQPPSSGPAAVKGKTVWYISCGQLYEACADGAKGFLAASKVLGWHTTLVDGKADPSTASAAIRQAIAAHVDGIALMSFDCASIKSALEEAKKAQMPVVESFSFDCGDPGSPGTPLFAANLKMRGMTLPQFRMEWGRARADYAIAKTDGKAKVINLAEQSQFTTKAESEGFEAELKTCSGCQLVDNVKFTFAEVPNGTFTAKVLAALRQHPEATVLSVPGDAYFALGVTQALKQSGRAGKIMVVGGEGLEIGRASCRERV